MRAQKREKVSELRLKNKREVTFKEWIKEEAKLMRETKFLKRHKNNKNKL